MFTKERSQGQTILAPKRFIHLKERFIFLNNMINITVSSLNLPGHSVGIAAYPDIDSYLSCLDHIRIRMR